MKISWKKQLMVLFAFLFILAGFGEYSSVSPSLGLQGSTQPGLKSL
jgi:hypothetical protein